MDGSMDRKIRTFRALARTAVRGGEEADVSLRIAYASAFIHRSDIACLGMMQRVRREALCNPERDARVRNAVKRTCVLGGHFSQTV